MYGQTVWGIYLNALQRGNRIVHKLYYYKLYYKYNSITNCNM